MSRINDEKVVSMTFDNQRFENNVKESLGTIEKLKQSLNFKGVSKGFEDLNKSTNKLDLSNVSESVNQIQAKFSALQVIGGTALVNLTNAAMVAGKRITSSLTITPIKTGLKEYETQINAIQTIMANTSSKGTTMDQVKNALAQLNDYSDKTIYNFTEMTRNIGTFTAAGVGLDQSVSSIKGIANLAAVSGSNSQQAATAMYQLSQALASGTVKLMDWNSVVNAGMGGQVFQDSIKETARMHGVAIDQMIKDEGSFRETLSSGWLTSDILTETLAKFTGDLNADQLRTMGYAEDQIQAIIKMGQTANDAATKVKTLSQLWSTMQEAAQSGWAKTWELIIGDFNEAKSLWSGLSDVFGSAIKESADSRNKLLEGALSPKWNEFNEKIKAVGISTDDFKKKLNETAKEHNVSIDDMVSKYGSLEKAVSSGKIPIDVINNTLNKFAQTGKDASKSLSDFSDAQLKNIGYTNDEIDAIRKLSEETTKTEIPLSKLIEQMTKPSGREMIFDTISNSMKPLLQVLDSFQTSWKNAFPPMTSEQLYNTIEAVHTFSESLVFSDGTIDKLTRTLSGLFAVLDLISSFMGGGLKIGFTVLQEFLKAVGFVDVGILSITATVGDAIVAFRDWYEQHNLINGAIKFGVTYIIKFAEAIEKVLTKLYQLPVVQNGLDNISKSFNGMYDTIGKCISGSLTELNKFIDSIGNIDSIDFENLFSSFEQFFNLDGIPGNIMTGLAEGLVNGSSKVIDIVCGIGKSLLSAICEVLGIHSPSKEFKTIGENSIIGLNEGVKEGGSSVISGLKNLGTTMLNALKSIDFGSIFVMGTVTGLGFILLKTIKILDKFATPFAKLGNVFDGATKVLGSTSKLIDAKAFSMKTEALLNISKAIGVLAASLAVLSLLDQANLWSAVGAISILTLGMVALLKVTDKMESATGFGKLAVLMIGVSSSLLLLSFALKKLASIDPEQAKTAMLEMGALIVGLTVVLAAYGKFVNGEASKNINNAGKMFIKMAASMALLAIVIKIIASISDGDIYKGLAVIVSIELLFVAVMAVSKLSGQNASKAGSMFIKMGIAIGLLAYSIKVISSISLSDIVKGMLVIAGITALFSGLVIVSQFAGSNASKTGSMFLKMSLAIGILSMSIKLISELSLSEIAKGLLVIGGITLLFSSFIILSKFVGDNAGKAGSMFLKMAMAIGILALTIKLIGTISGGDIVKGMLVIGGLEVLFAAIIGVSMLAGKNASQAGSMLLKMSMSIMILVGAIAVLSLLDPKDILVATTAISAIMVCFAGLIAATSLAKESTKTLVILIGAFATLIAGIAILATLDQSKVASITASLAALVGMFALLVASTSIMGKSMSSLLILTGVVAMLGGIIYVLSSLPIGSTLSVTASLSLLLLSLSTACLILSAVGLTGPAALIGVGSLVVLIAAVGGLIASIGALATSFPGMEDFLNKGIPILEKIGYGLGSFFGNIIGGFTSGILTGLPAIGNSLSQFMTSIQPFIDGAKTIDGTSMDGVKALAETILILTAADVLQGITSWLTGGSSMVDFANQLVPFGEGLSGYSSAVSGIDNKVITDSANAALTLANMAKDIPNSGGLLGMFMGENDVSMFASQLPLFGEGLSGYSSAVSGIDNKVITDSANAALTLANMADELPNSGGFFSWFMGDNNLSTFASRLEPFGEGLNAYCTQVQNIDPNAVTASVSVVESLSNMIQKLDGISSDGATTFKNSINILAQSNVGDFVAAFSSSYEKLSTVGIDIANSIINGIASRKSAITSTINEMISSLLTAIDNTKTKFESSGSALIEQFSSGITESKSKVNNAISSLLRSAVSKSDSYKDDFYDAGANIAQGFANGIDEYSYLASAKASAMANSAAVAARRTLEVRSPSRVFDRIGVYSGIGFINGLDEYANKARDAGVRMAESAKIGLSSTISKISEFINSDIDSQPTIRPVLDLSNVSNSVGTLNSLLNFSPSLGVLARTKSISSMMNLGQNGINDDLIAEIKGLKKAVGSTKGDTYIVDGITYDDGSNVSEAIKEIIKAARIERRK